VAKRGKKPKAPTRTLSVLLPEDLYAELMLLRSDEMLSPGGNTRYGAVSGYFERLCREDLAKLKDEARKHLL